MITGGTGYLGRRLVSALLDNHPVTILGRDPEMQAKLWLELEDPWLGTVPGDICDASVLDKALEDVDTVIHAAAMVRGCEHDIGQAIHTNIKGAQRLIEATKGKVDKVLLISSCAACKPSSVYGATKLLAECMFMFMNTYTNTETCYSVIRLGNIIGSGVVDYFRRWLITGEIQVTDPNMTRFWITARQAVAHILRCLDIMGGGEIFVPWQPSARLSLVMQAVAPDCTVNLIGPRPGEYKHATLIAAHEARYAYPDVPENMYIIRPGQRQEMDGRWQYDSLTNPWRLTLGEVKEMVDALHT